MNLFNEFAKDLRVILDDLAARGQLPGGLDLSKVTVEPPRDASHGDLSTNAALVLARFSPSPSVQPSPHPRATRTRLR